MGKVFLSITMSLDGFSAGQMITQENPMSLNGQLLHQWLFANKQKEDEELTFKPQMKTSKKGQSQRTLD